MVQLAVFCTADAANRPSGKESRWQSRHIASARSPQCVLDRDELSSESAMKAFMLAEPHGPTMRKLLDWCNEAAWFIGLNPTPNSRLDRGSSANAARGMKLESEPSDRRPDCPFNPRPDSTPPATSASSSRVCTPLSGLTAFLATNSSSLNQRTWQCHNRAISSRASTQRDSHL